MVSFPLLNLPQVPLDLIIRNFTPIQIFRFSLISKKSHALAKHAKILVDTLTWVIPHWEETIRIETQGTQYLASMRGPFGYSKRRSRARWQIDNVMVGIIENEEEEEEEEVERVFCKRKKDSKILCKVISSRLLEIMKVRAFSCHIFDAEIPPYILNVTRCFKEFTVLTEHPISHEQARFLLEEITVEDFDWMARVERGFSFTKPIRCRKLSIHAEWFTGGNLLNTDCESMKIYKARVTQTDALEFLKKWKNGGFPRLRDLRLYPSESNGWTFSVRRVDGQGRRIVKDCNGNTGVLIIGLGCMVFKVNPINRDV